MKHFARIFFRIRSQSSRGFTAFLALLVSSLVLSLAIAIYDITIRELEFATFTAQSEYAFYAADTGAECALYWDTKYTSLPSAFGTSTTAAWPNTGSGIWCNSQDISTLWGTPTKSANAATTTFTITFPGTRRCATVTVAKYTVSGGSLRTTVTSQGYNVCTAGTPDRIERIFQVKY